MSVVSLMHSKQIARPLLVLPSMGAPQLQQRILGREEIDVSW